MKREVTATLDHDGKGRAPAGLVGGIAAQCRTLTLGDAGYLLATYPRRMRRAIASKLPRRMRAPAMAIARSIIARRKAQAHA
jgi:hypothetical protein